MGYPGSVDAGSGGMSRFEVCDGHVNGRRLLEAGIRIDRAWQAGDLVINERAPTIYKNRFTGCEDR